MSDIRATTISDAAGTGPITLTKQSAAKVFIRYDSNGGNTINISFNVSSVTDNGTGHQTTNFTNAMSGSFQVVTGANDVDASSSFYNLSPHTYASTNVQCDSWKQTASTTTQVDINRSMLTVFGDLA